LKGLVDEWDIRDVTDFRCDVCANCPVCKRSARERTKSLQEDHEQEVIERSVTVDSENKRILVDLPFIRDPVDFLTKKHGGSDNRYQALRIYKTQCRKPDDVKEKLRATHRDLVERGFMVKMNQLTEEQQETIMDAPFRHYYPWRAVFKDGSQSTPVRIVVDPTASSLNLTLAKGVNMLSKIPEILIKFRTHEVAYTSDITKMYNMLHLKDSALPYSLFLFGDTLDPDVQPDL
jgi:hypothetical protein